MVKLDDISADYIATLPGEQILAEVTTWARRYDPDLAAVLAAEPDLALRALAIEREDTDNPRKDLRKWADFRAVYGYFFPELFEPVTDPADARFGGLDPDLVRAVADAFARGYTPPGAGHRLVRPDPPARRRPRVRAQPEGLQAGPGRLPGLDPGGVPDHPGPADRDAAQPRPGPGGGRARDRGGAPPGSAPFCNVGPAGQVESR